MRSIKKIHKLLSDIDIAAENRIDKIFLNAIKNEFIKVPGEIVIPKIHVKDLDYGTAFSILKDIEYFLPEFLYGHTILEARKPPSEQHSLHFIRSIKGQAIDFIHILKIDLKFGGDSINIIEKGSPTSYPSFRTDRVYYKSRLVPVKSIKVHKTITDFQPIRLFRSDYIESDKHFFAAAIFDDVDKSAVTGEINEAVNLDVFSISRDLYPFIVYDYFSACLNVLYPVTEEIEKSAALFEPVFLFIYSKYNDLNDLIDNIRLSGIFKDSLEFDNEGLKLTAFHLDRLREYFNRFVIARDNELMLKGWWRFDISNI